MKKKELKKKKISIIIHILKKDWLRWTILFLILILTIYFSITGLFAKIISNLGEYGIIGIFISGLFFGYSFASVPALAMFLQFSKIYSPMLIAIIAALGVVTENILVYFMFKKQIPEEFKKVVDEYIYQRFHLKSSSPLIVLIALVIMTTPIPNELGIYLLSQSKFSDKLFIVFTFITSCIGIYITATIGTLL